MMRFHASPALLWVVLAAFLGLLVLGTIVAHSRPSGNTGIDMLKVQQLRKKSITDHAPTP